MWKDIKGYENKYQVSDIGEVRSYTKFMKGNNLKPSYNEKGYACVNLYNNSKFKRAKIHLLVWDAFGYGQRNGHCVQVDHIDGNKLNNRIENLQLLTNRQNVSKGKSKFRELPTGVCKYPWGYTAQAQIKGNDYHLGTFKCQSLAELAYKKFLISNGVAL